jgi:hypothetical protein
MLAHSASLETLHHSLEPPFLRTNALMASTPATATSLSCAGVPVLTPIAPTTNPSTTIGTPPPMSVNLKKNENGSGR